MADTAQSEEDGAPRVKTILLVEDDTDIGEFLVEALKMEAYQVLHVTDATAALEIVKTVVPNLFVLDYRLPGFDGLELADRLRAVEILKHVPVLLMSANLPKRELEKRQIPFIEKPFEIEKLLQTVEHLLAS